MRQGTVQPRLGEMKTECEWEAAPRSIPAPSLHIRGPDLSAGISSRPSRAVTAPLNIHESKLEDSHLSGAPAVPPAGRSDQWERAQPPRGANLERSRSCRVPLMPGLGLNVLSRIVNTFN